MSSQVAMLRLFPGITAATIHAFLAPPIKGVVLETFGAGNAPQRSDFLSAVKEAYERGVVIVAISQCPKGSVENMYKYETGAALRDAGVIPGGDMTPECALTKLAYLLSKPELSLEDVRRLVGVSLRGEMSVSATQQSTVKALHKEETQEILGHILRLSSLQTSFVTGDKTPVISLNLSNEVGGRVIISQSEEDRARQEMDNALLPILIHQAVARDDLEALSFALQPKRLTARDSAPEDIQDDGQQMIHGLINAIDIASGRTPLHTAALRGAKACTEALLKMGALVHVRDALDHTALYYATRQGHSEIVETLLGSGAHLMGSDTESGLQDACRAIAAQRGHLSDVECWDKVLLLKH